MWGEKLIILYKRMDAVRFCVGLHYHLNNKLLRDVSAFEKLFSFFWGMVYNASIHSELWFWPPKNPLLTWSLPSNNSTRIDCWYASLGTIWNELYRFTELGFGRLRTCFWPDLFHRITRPESAADMHRLKRIANDIYRFTELDAYRTNRKSVVVGSWNVRFTIISICRLVY